MQHSFIYPSEDSQSNRGKHVAKEVQEAHEVQMGYRRCRESGQQGRTGHHSHGDCIPNAQSGQRHGCSFSDDRNVGHWGEDCQEIKLQS